MRKTILLAVTLVAGVAYAQPSSPQTPTAQPGQAAKTWEIDRRWAPWLGCWRGEDDLSGTGARLCITPDSVSGVKLLTVLDDDVRMTEIVVPDKVTRPVNDKECHGTSRSEWSRNNQQLFRFTDVTCGAESPRKISGLAFLVEGPVLVDVQFADVSGNKSVRVRRFHPSGNQKLPDGSFAPRSADVRGSAFSTSWTVDDVIEVSSKVPNSAVEAALSEMGAGFRLDKTALLALDKAGVSPGVIDLMIALSYPKRFVVEKASMPADGGYAGVPIGWWDPFFSPVLPFSMMGRDCYSAFYAYGPSWSCGAYYSGYGFGPYYGYGYGFYPSYGGYYPGWIGVNPAPPGPIAPEGGSLDGRVVNGRGYTQIRNRETTPVSTAGGGSVYGGDSSSSGGTSGTNSSGSSGVSSGGGYSGGGSSGGDSGRTAVPRPPGGGR